MKRTAKASWSGNLLSGNGHLSSGSGILKNTPYSFKTRFENEPGTNPEELIAAAHAGCFTMALSAFLEKSGYEAIQLSTDALVTLEQVEGAWTVTQIDLALTGKVPNINSEKFVSIANEAKKLCPISRLLNTTIHLDAKLEQ